MAKFNKIYTVINFVAVISVFSNLKMQADGRTDGGRTDTTKL